MSSTRSSSSTDTASTILCSKPFRPSPSADTLDDIKSPAARPFDPSHSTVSTQKCTEVGSSSVCTTNADEDSYSMMRTKNDGYDDLYTLLPPQPDILYSKNLDSRPAHPLDGPGTKSLTLQILHQGGRARFPRPSYHLFAHVRTYSRRFQRVFPGHFTDKEFKRIWDSEPRYLYIPRDTFIEEPYFQDVIWKTRVPRDQLDQAGTTKADRVIKRGTVFVVNGHNSLLVKYITTVRREIDDATSLIQLDAFSYQKDQLNPRNPDWPSLLIVIPNSLCAVPMPKRLARQYYSKYIAFNPTLSKLLDSIRRFFCLPTKSEHKWEVELM